MFGWMIYSYLNLQQPWKLCCLCHCHCCECCRQGDEPVVHGEVLGIEEEGCAQLLEQHTPQGQLLFACFECRIAMPPWGIILDHSTQTVVISVRGTLSLKDAITDALATLVDLKPAFLRWGNPLAATPESLTTHRGMLTAAEHIRGQIYASGILEVLLGMEGVEVGEGAEFACLFRLLCSRCRTHTHTQVEGLKD